MESNPRVSPPRFIYFDLGNVLLTFDHQRACQSLSHATQVPAAVIEEMIFTSGLQEAYETGHHSTRDFANLILHRLRHEHAAPHVLTHDDVARTCSDIFEINISILPLVAALHSARYPLGILSNTCEAHWEFVSRGRYRLIETVFLHRVLSYEAKSMKPATEIYHEAIRRTGCSPEEIFFMDDRLENVEGARQAGIDAEQFTTVSALIRQLRDRGVRINL